MRRSSSTYRLRNGALVHVRGIRPSDEGGLRAAFFALSPRSRQQRFLRPVSSLSDNLWRYLSEVDGQDHVALVALAPDGESIVGVARFIRHSTEPWVAEIAVTIADAWQLRGLGSLLVDLLVEAARRRGIAAFAAYALADNIAIRRLLARCGRVQATHSGAEVALRVLLEGKRTAGKVG